MAVSVFFSCFVLFVAMGVWVGCCCFWLCFVWAVFVLGLFWGFVYSALLCYIFQCARVLKMLASALFWLGGLVECCIPLICALKGSSRF